MNLRYYFCFFAFLVVYFSSGQSMLGKMVQAPIEVPEIFGPGVISISGRTEMGITISEDNQKVIFGIAEEEALFFAEWSGGNFKKPVNMVFPENQNTYFPMIGPDGSKLYFSKSKDGGESDIWVGDFLGNKVKEATKLSTKVNSQYREAGHGLTLNGNLYFTSNRDQEQPCCGNIYSIAWEAIEKEEAMKVLTLSSSGDDEGLFVSPDEDYIVIQSWKIDYNTRHDLYISFKDKQNEWTELVRLSDAINTDGMEQRPFVTRDNKLLFFNRITIESQGGVDVSESDIYWVQTASIFKPFVYNNDYERVVKYNEPFNIQFREDLFKDIDDQNLSIQLTASQDRGLPNWLTWNAETLTLSGTYGVKHALTFYLVATDSYGNEGQLEFEFEVVGE